MLSEDGPIAAVPTAPPWDPVAQRRGDGGWIDRLWQSAEARVALFRDGLVAAGADGRPLWLPSTALPRRPDTWAFLGMDGGGCPRFAAIVPEADGPAAGAADWLAVRAVPTGDAVELLAAAALMNWHGSHPFCPRCGTRTSLAESGWQRVCPADGSRHFPRVDPAVIMLVHDGDGRALLGRQRRWPSGWFSTLAGFVEPGESLEAAVAREVAEEVGLQVVAARYLASQPWPFPNSLMIGFHARVEYGQPVPDGDEIGEAVWVSRESLHRDCATGRIVLPPGLSISRWLIQQWYGAELPGEWSR